MATESSQQRAAARLLAELTKTSSLACATAREQIPALIEAEASVLDVDRDPAFTALLEHFDTCAECLAIYEATAAAYELLDQPAAQPIPQPPRFFVPLQRSEHAVVRMLQGLRRRFELSLTIPALTPVAAAEPTPIELLSTTMTNLPDPPTLQVHLHPTPPTATLHVLFHDPQTPQWSIRLVVDAYSYQAAPDSSGLATIHNLDLTTLRQARQIDLLLIPATTTAETDDPAHNDLND
ncbi:MAG: hypothetical protein Fur005_30010 [Roseiflexaceae bacterium]